MPGRAREGRTTGSRRDAQCPPPRGLSTETTSKLVSELVTRTIVWAVLAGALLFGAAGTVRWPEGWILLVLVCGLGLFSGLVIVRHDPALVQERLRSPIQEGQKSWDKILLSLFLLLSLVQYAVSGLDAVRFRTSDMPAGLKLTGALGIVAGLYLNHIALLANTFAAAVVKVQAERKQQVVAAGPYAYVRHPMYAGAIPLLLGTGLLLGSWWGVAIGFVLIVLLACRAVLEEGTLKRELDGYEAYAARVRYRLVPGVW